MDSLSQNDVQAIDELRRVYAQLKEELRRVIVGQQDTIERLAGIKGGPDTEIETFSSNVRMSPEGMAADSIKFIAPAIGTLNGAGTVSPENALDFRMSATVHTSGVAGIVANTPIPFTIGGTASDPTFHPDVKAVVKEEATKAVEKAAGGLLKGLLGGKK